jgi:hypothetical protein
MIYINASEHRAPALGQGQGGRGAAWMSTGSPQEIAPLFFKLRQQALPDCQPSVTESAQIADN